MKLLKNDIFTYQLEENVLTSIECKNLIDEFNKFKTAETIVGTINYRDAKIGLYDDESILLKKVRKIVSIKTNTDIDNQETPISFIKYETGNQYKPHHDFFGNIENIPQPQMGDRLITSIIYLNDNYIGGETVFPSENIKIKGRVGDLLFWKNLNEDRTPNRRTKHAGLPVIDGIKYILVIWIREKKFNNDNKKTLL